MLQEHLHDHDSIIQDKKKLAGNLSQKLTILLQKDLQIFLEIGWKCCETNNKSVAPGMSSLFMVGQDRGQTNWLGMFEQRRRQAVKVTSF